MSLPVFPMSSNHLKVCILGWFNHFIVQTACSSQPLPGSFDRIGGQLTVDQGALQQCNRRSQRQKLPGTMAPWWPHGGPMVAPWQPWPSGSHGHQEHRGEALLNMEISRFYLIFVHRHCPEHVPSKFKSASYCGLTGVSSSTMCSSYR